MKFHGKKNQHPKKIKFKFLFGDKIPIVGNVTSSNMSTVDVDSSNKSIVNVVSSSKSTMDVVSIVDSNCVILNPIVVQRYNFEVTKK
jgi:hypothetical protein